MINKINLIAFNPKNMKTSYFRERNAEVNSHIRSISVYRYYMGIG
jgi:hypothetical protein